jgi:hypothetical protein
MVEADGHEIYFGNKGQLSGCGGMLDVDMNVTNVRRDAVENICYPNKNMMKDGLYKLIVHSFSQRETKDVGFDVEVEFGGVIHTFAYPKAVKRDEKVVVAEIQYSKLEGFKILKSLPMAHSHKEVWGLTTNMFCNVSVAMLSPNYWDGKGVGNKHYFFMLEGCINTGTVRGFFNEFLTSELDKHRKVFEMVGNKLSMEGGEKQLSGLGFSSTKKDEVVCRVNGTFTRTIKLIF